MRTAPRTGMWDALSSLPPLRRVSETGLVAGWRQCTVCPVHAVTAQSLPPYHVLHRVGTVAQLPGPIGCYLHASRDANHQSWTPAAARPFAAARTHVYGGGNGVWVKQAWVLRLCVPGSIPVPPNRYTSSTTGIPVQVGNYLVGNYHLRSKVPVLRYKYLYSTCTL